jgi:hypothetical protein
LRRKEGRRVFDSQLACVFSRIGSESAFKGRERMGLGRGEGFRDEGAGAFEGEAVGGGGGKERKVKGEG